MVYLYLTLLLWKAFLFNSVIYVNPLHAVQLSYEGHLQVNYYLLIAENGRSFYISVAFTPELQTVV